MALLDDVLGSAVPGGKSRTRRVWRRRICNLGAGPSSIGMGIGRPFTAVLICAAAMLLISGAASAAPLDAQQVNAAQLPAPSGKGRARAPSAAAIIKAEVLLGRAGFSPGVIDGKTGSNFQIGCRRVSGRKRNSAQRQSRRSNVGPPDCDIRRPGARRV